MDDLELKQQMVARERFAPEAADIRAAVLAGRSARAPVRNDSRRPRLLTAAAAAVVVVIVVTIGLVRVLQPTPQVSEPPSPTSSPTPGWVGIAWRLHSVSRGGTDEDVGGTGGIVLNFAANGAVNGESTCFWVTGSWTDSDQTVKLGPLERREHSCPLDPQQRSEIVEEGLTSFLTVGATGGSVAGHTLTLRSGPYEFTFREGGPTVVASSSADPPMTMTAVAQMSAPPSTMQIATAPTRAELAPVRQSIVDASVYDPMGDGVGDNVSRARLAFDGRPATSWGTSVYTQQFPSVLKPGVGLMVKFAGPITPTAVIVASTTPGTTVEIRSATAPDLAYDQTRALARATISTGSTTEPGLVTVQLTDAPRSQYLVVFVVHLAADGSHFRSQLNEITVLGR